MAPSDRAVRPVLVLWIVLLSVKSIKSANLEFTIDEEQPIGTVIGNAKSAFTGPTVVVSTDRRFSLFQETPRLRDLFELDPISGDLKIGRRVDRDEMCPREPNCRVAFKIIQQNPDSHANVQVRILDINDNPPAWQIGKIEPLIRLTIREDHPMEQTVPIPAAHDPDLGANGSISYQLDNRGAPFGLRHILDDGQLFLETSSQLDRERHSSYNMTLLAIDQGSPPQTGSIRILIEVADVNDNWPQFSKSLFVRKIFENEPVNGQLLRLNATDEDSGSYGRVVFDFAPDLLVSGAGRQEQQRLARQHFRVTLDGRVMLKRKLDYDSMRTKSIEFVVMARDDSQEVTDRRTSTAVVSISVLDHNDEAPTVEVCSPAGKCPAVGILVEGPPVAARVAMVIVRDPDTDERVSCRVFDAESPSSVPNVESSIFELIPDGFYSRPQSSVMNSWTYFLTTKTQLDRERTPRICFRIVCTDSANHHSPASSPNSHCIDVGDVNDSPPRLISPSPIRLHVQEEGAAHRPIGRPLSEFLTDDDAGINAQLNYSIDRAATPPETVAAFAVDPVTGSVTPRQVLDREQRPEYSMKLRVSDRGSPPLSILVDVVILVDDVNDHRPEFVPDCTETASQMRVSENLNPPAVVGRAVARDLDSPTSGNGQVLYRLEHSSDSRAFSINRTSGVITTAIKLDRERQSHYSLRVLAEDQPRNGQQRLTSTCQLPVTVQDVNDNPPRFRDLPTVFRVDKPEPGHLVGQVFAEDPDEGDNQKIIFKLVNTSLIGDRFIFDSKSGNIVVGRSLHDLLGGGGGGSGVGHLAKDGSTVTFLLQIKACDGGTPQLCSQPRDFQLIVPTQPNSAFRGGGSNANIRNSNPDGRQGVTNSAALFNNEAVIICLIVTLLVLTISCFFVVCFIIRRRSIALSSSNRRTNGAAAAAVAAASSGGNRGVSTGMMIEQQPIDEIDPDSDVPTKMIIINQPVGYDCPPNYKTYREDDYGAYSSTQQLQQFNKLRHATVGRDYRYCSASPSIGRLLDSESGYRLHHLQQQQQYQTLAQPPPQTIQQQQLQQSVPMAKRKMQQQQQQQSMSHLYYEIEGRGNRVGAMSATPQSHRQNHQSHTLPRGGFSVDAMTGFQQQQQQQQQSSTQQRTGPFSPYTEASFV